MDKGGVRHSPLRYHSRAQAEPSETWAVTNLEALAACSLAWAGVTNKNCPILALYSGYMKDRALGSISNTASFTMEISPSEFMAIGEALFISTLLPL